MIKYDEYDYDYARAGAVTSRNTNCKANKKLDWLIVYIDFNYAGNKPAKYKIMDEYRSEEIARRALVNRRWFHPFVCHRLQSRRIRFFKIWANV